MKPGLASFTEGCLRRRRRRYWRYCRPDESCRQQALGLQPASPHILRCPDRYHRSTNIGGDRTSQLLYEQILSWATVRAEEEKIVERIITFKARLGEGSSALPEVGTSRQPRIAKKGTRTGGGLHVCRPFPVRFFKNADSHVAPPSDLGTAVGAGDNAPIGRMGRDGESIAATLTAPEGAGVRVRLDRLRHDTASI